jgi:hypothetical protein
MGGSGGGSYTNYETGRLTNIVREDQEKSGAGFEVQLAAYLSELLAHFNSRDVDLVRTRLEDAKIALQDNLESTLDQVFGGSVAKHTYVDGMSDIDSLVIINGSKIEEHEPVAILGHMERILRDGMGPGVTVEHGRMAVTINYPDGMCIQILPSIRTEAGLKVPAASGAGWSHIDPEGFRMALTKTNDACGGRLIPTIKLAKAAISNLPEQYRLTGYHVESAAIAAFRNYDGPKTTSAMLPLFFERAKQLVLSPIVDSTGQSVHVDEYLGPANSEQRQYVSRLLASLGKRMANASAAQSKLQWQALFADE